MSEAKGGELAETEVSRLLKGAGGSYVRAFDKLVEQAEREVARKPRSTVSERQKQWRDTLAKMDRQGLAAIRRRMAGYVALVKGHDLAFSEQPRLLDRQEQVRLMDEYLAFRDIDDFLKVRREWIREVVNAHITESLAAEVEGGEPVHPHPEHMNGRVEVPEMGKAFVREACGPRDPRLDEDKLRQLLGEDAWQEVCELKYEFSPERLMKLAERDPSVLEKVKDCFVDAGWKPGRFIVRDIT